MYGELLRSTTSHQHVIKVWTSIRTTYVYVYVYFVRSTRTVGLLENT
jgi:hypothetical protein